MGFLAQKEAIFTPTQGVRQFLQQAVLVCVRHHPPLHQPVQVQPLHRVSGPSRDHHVVPQMQIDKQERFCQVHRQGSWQQCSATV